MKYPQPVKEFLQRGCFLVGSSADPEAAVSSDWDIIVPHEKWRAVAPVMIPENAKRNKLGGWRFEVDGQEYDVWPDSLDRYLREAVRCRSRVFVVTRNYSLRADGI